MADELPIDVIADEPPKASQPQLRLHHLFALTAVAAVLLALNGPHQDYWSVADYRPPSLIQTFFIAWGVLYVILLAVAVTALAYGIAWQRMGLEFFDQPGHWLLVEIAVAGLFTLAPGIISRWLFSSMNGPSSDFPFEAMIIVGIYSLITAFLLPLALNIYIGIKKCRQRWWSAVFYLKSVANFLFGVGHLASVGLLLFATRRDRQEQIPRDPSHWCGVWVQLVLNVLTFVSTIVTYLNMYYMFARM